LLGCCWSKVYKGPSTDFCGDHMKRAFTFICIIGFLVTAQIPLQVLAVEYDCVSGTVNLKEQHLKVSVYYYEGEEEWGQYVLDITVEALPILEGLAGFPYPHDYEIHIYPKTDEEIKGWAGQNLGMRGIWINRDEYTPETIKELEGTSTVIHENAHHWAGHIIYQKKWLKEGYAELLTCLTFEKMGRDEDVSWEKDKWFYTYIAYQLYDFPLDEWETKSSATPQEGTTHLAYSKSALFCQDIYDKYGLHRIQQINNYLYTEDIQADSITYMELLEQFTGKDQKEFFVGWVFSEDLDYRKWQEAEETIQKLKKLKSDTVSTIKEKYGFEVGFSVDIALAEALLRKFEFVEAIKVAEGEIEKINEIVSEFERYAPQYLEAQEYYSSAGIIFEKNIPVKKLDIAEDHLLFLKFDLLEKRLGEFYEEMEKLEEYYPELEALYNELVAGYVPLEYVVELISQGEYEKALAEMNQIKSVIQEYESTEDRLKDIDWFTDLGMSISDEHIKDYGDDLTTAREEINKRNFENALDILAQIREGLSEDRSRGIGACVIAAVAVLGSASGCFLLVRRSKKKKVKEGENEKIRKE
jgi:hypothetical protein